MISLREQVEFWQKEAAGRRDDMANYTRIVSETIDRLNVEVSKLTKERDIKEHCITQFELEDLRMKEQLAALAEQNKKLRDALTICVCAMQDYQAGIGITEMFDRGERIGRNVLLTSEFPDLTSPVLNETKGNK